MDWTEIEHKWRQMACRAQGVALSEAHQNAVRTLIPDAPNAGNAPLDGTVTRANTHPGMKSCADPRIA